jgi:hypothetical protein
VVVVVQQSVQLHPIFWRSAFHPVAKSSTERVANLEGLLRKNSTKAAFAPIQVKLREVFAVSQNFIAATGLLHLPWQMANTSATERRGVTKSMLLASRKVTPLGIFCLCVLAEKNE